jgi:hypothetical protein
MSEVHQLYQLVAVTVRQLGDKPDIIYLLHFYDYLLFAYKVWRERVPIKAPVLSVKGINRVGRSGQPWACQRPQERLSLPEG